MNTYDDATCNDAYNRLLDARCRLQIREPWYGFMAIGMNWQDSEMRDIQDGHRKLQVKVTSDGIKVYFYPPWVATKSLEELFGAIQHVMNHLVRLHTIRRSGRILDLWDRATDMVANGPKNDPRAAYIEDGKRPILPEKNMLFIPDGWPVDESAEFFYDRLKDEVKDEETNPPSNPGPGSCEYSAVDDHGDWDQSDLSDDEIRQMIHQRARDASEKAIGKVPGHLQQALEELKKPVVSWHELMKQWVGVNVGNRRSTYSRQNRRNSSFGIKGVSRHACSEMMVIVDTSGSITNEELEQFFGEIECVSARCKVWVMLWDTAFNGITRYRRGDWKTFNVKGGGGTDMEAPFLYLEENRLIKDVTVLLTDGEVGGQWPEKKPYPTLFCITTSTNDLPDWGQVVRIQVG